MASNNISRLSKKSLPTTAINKQMEAVILISLATATTQIILAF
jgi:hypothetical protein